MLATHDPTLARVFAPRTTIAPDGTVEGYASLFGEIDQARDMVMAGAFRETLRLRGVRRIPMLFQHDPAEPIGIWQELVEDSRGLYARGRLIPEVQRGREVLALVKSGAIDGLSIGFKTVKGRVEPRTRIRRIEQVDLWEISIVTFPLLTGARVRAVKDVGAVANAEGDRHERLFRRYPRFSFARSRAEAKWKAIFRNVAESKIVAGASRIAPAAPGSGTRLERVDASRPAPLSRRDRRIRGWIAESALRAMADQDAARTSFALISLAARGPGHCRMFQDKPEWIAYQRQRWLRPDVDRSMPPDARRWIRPEAQKWLLPDRKLRPQSQPDDHCFDLAAECEWLCRMRRELASLKAELKFRQFVRWLKAGSNPDQPRVPAGNPDGGQWTSGGGGGGSGLVASVDAGASEAVSPNPLRPDVHLVASRVTIDYSQALTGISRIDDTTKALVDTLATVVAILPEGSGPLYGTAVHTAFAGAVRAQGLEGIGYFNVETTFSLRDGARYGSEDSIRTDVVLKNEAGEIIAIYDVKAGSRGISQERAAELRAKTRTGAEVPIIELNIRRQRVFLKSDRAGVRRVRLGMIHGKVMS